MNGTFILRERPDAQCSALRFQIGQTHADALGQRFRLLGYGSTLKLAGDKAAKRVGAKAVQELTGTPVAENNNL